MGKKDIKNGRIKKPNLFIVGASKSGTTALYSFLKQHPDVFMPEIKEPRFFCKDLIREGDRFLRKNRMNPFHDRGYFGVRSEKDYLQLFKDWGKEKIAGEASPQYLYSKSAAKEIRRFNPDARIIIMLRNPVDWLHSLHSQELRSGHETVIDLEEALRLEQERKTGRRIPVLSNLQAPSALFYSDRAKFSAQVERYYDAFDRNQVKVILFEDFKKNNAKTYREVLKFLGLSQKFLPKFDVVNSSTGLRFGRFKIIGRSPLVTRLLKVSRYVLTPGLYRRYKDVMSGLETRVFFRGNSLPMSSELRDRLMKKFDQEVRRLGKLIGRDLASFWGYGDEIERKTSLLFVVGTFPTVSENFIYRELSELSKDKSLDVGMVYFKKGPRNIQIPGEFGFKIWHFWPGLGEILLRNLRYFLSHPLKYLELVRLILFGKHDPLKLKLIDFGSLAVGVALALEKRTAGFDRIHAHFGTWQSTVALVLSQVKNLPLTFTGHGQDIFARNALLREKVALSESVAVCSEFGREFLVEFSGPEYRSKIFCVRHGLDLDDFKEPRRSRRNRRPLVLSVGRLIELKGFSYLIDALAIVRDRGYDFESGIIGNGPEYGNLARKIAENGLSDRVRLLGMLPFREVNDHMRKSDLFVAPSIDLPGPGSDNIPNVILEAMASGVPVISTPVAGIREAVTDGKNGLLVGERDPSALAEAIIKLLSDGKLRERFRRAGYKKVRRDFDARRNSRRLKMVILRGLQRI